MRIVTISGNTGTGKTTLLNLLEKRGFGVINTDKITQRILRSSGNFQKIKQRFFTEPEFRVAHEKWIRPKIYKEVIKEGFELMVKGHTIIFIEVPLLFEVGLNPYFYTIVVACDKSIQMQRVRNIDYLCERLALQLPIKEKIRLAQLVIYNNGDIEELERNIDELNLHGCSIYCCLLMLLIIALLMIVPE